MNYDGPYPDNREQMIQRIKGLESQVAAFRDALHLALDWMGRAPQNAWDAGHLKAHKEQVMNVLAGRDKNYLALTAEMAKMEDKAFEEARKRDEAFRARSTPYDTSGTRGEPETPA